jgi:hypothetical protein
MKVPDLFVGKRLFVGEGKPEILGRGPKEVRGSGYVEGPMIVGNPTQFSTPNPNELGTAMFGETKNKEMKPIPFYSLFVRTYARIKSFLKVDTLLTVKLVKAKIIYTDVLMAKSKNFVIDHPSKEGKKLVYACLEGPEHSVFVRGRITNRTIINLPDYWKDLVDESTITVQLQPIGAHQNIIVKRVGQNQVHLQGHGLPIDCYYHIFAERKDIEKLETEID